MVAFKKYDTLSVLIKNDKRCKQHYHASRLSRVRLFFITQLIFDREQGACTYDLNHRENVKDSSMRLSF